MAIDSGPASRIIGPTIFASGWQELGDLAKTHARSPAVVDPGFRSPADPPETDSIRLFRGLPTELVCYATTASPPDALFEPATMAYSAVLRPGVDDHFDAIESAILQAADARRVRRLLDDVARRASADVERIFARVLAMSVQPCTVANLATHLRLSKRTLFRRCAALGIPSPKRLCSLGRIFTVERLAEWSNQPSGAVALALGFSDYANYRRLVRRMLGAPPSAIRQQGGLGLVARTVLRELAAGRAP